jgi:hypothetical protein
MNVSPEQGVSNRNRRHLVASNPVNIDEIETRLSKMITAVDEHGGPAAAAAAEARQAGEKVDTDERYYKYLGHSDTMEAAIADWHTAVNTPAAAGTSCSAEND